MPTRGTNCVVLGRSNIVGKPVASLMMQKANPGNATVTVLHSASTDIKEKCLEADIIIAALGSPGFVTADMVKPGATIIDVGTTRVPDPSRKSGFRSERGPQVCFHNPCPRRCRPHDHMLAHEEHTARS